ncbi:MAG: TauD/TfdA family dioxygenase [Ilumatobacter sp.]
MTALDAVAVEAVSAAVVGTGVCVEWLGRTARLHPRWLRERSTELGEIEPTNRQRVFVPTVIDADLRVVAVVVEQDCLVTTFSDGHVAHLDLPAIERVLGWRVDDEEPPAPEPWFEPPTALPYIDWAGVGWIDDEGDLDARIDFLESFFRLGYVILRNTPAEIGTVERIAHRLGYIVGHNFGWVFDVRAKPSPTDLAYTSLALPAHSDEPYRRPVPGIQMLHCISNEATGGDSTLVDGLAAAIALEQAHPEWHAALAATEVTWRYDMGIDTVVHRGHVLEYDRHGRYQQIRLNTKLDEPAPTASNLDAFYAGRTWLSEWTNDPSHQVTFRLEPGDVMFMDNHRALHGRTAFDPTSGHRHLQGCYIEHDGPDTMYRMSVRRRAMLGS